MFSEGADTEAKQIVYDYYRKRCIEASLQNSEDVASVQILPVLHGTDFSIAKSIMCTGFASLSLLYVVITCYATAPRNVGNARNAGNVGNSVVSSSSHKLQGWRVVWPGYVLQYLRFLLQGLSPLSPLY
jgi:hypothetical protein